MEPTILIEKRSFEMSCLIKLYRDLLIDNCLDETVTEKYKVQNLKVGLVNYYQRQARIIN